MYLRRSPSNIRQYYKRMKYGFSRGSGKLNCNNFNSSRDTFVQETRESATAKYHLKATDLKAKEKHIKASISSLSQRLKILGRHLM